MTESHLSAGTPAALGYRMPAEWERHHATWLSWPHNRDTWPDGVEPVEHVLAGAAAAIAGGEMLFINVLDDGHEVHVREILQARGVSDGVRFFHIPTDDAWVRDHGPIFVVRGEGHPSVAATSWQFNSWGEKYPPWEDDDAASTRMAASLGIPLFERQMVLEGGSIDVNGEGGLLTTTSCLLNPNRNPHLDRNAIEKRLREDLGISRIIWLADGVSGDDTDGHIDDIARFVAPSTIVAVVEEDPSDADFEPLRENLARLREARLPGGHRPEVVALPAPRPVFVRGERMPASYANFYIANRVVVVPTFSDPADAVALELLQRLFPDRRVVGMDCRDVIYGLGAIHCLTQQVPTGVTD